MRRILSVGSRRRYLFALARVLFCASCALLLVCAPSRAADPAKTLRVALSIAETTFDPAFASDAASDDIIGAIFDAMLDYDYLARPVKLIPRALEALPTVEDGGKAYLCKVRKGIYFTPDPVFKGVRRELTAADFAYGIKRILDPIVKSPWVWMLEGKLQGGDEARARATKSGRFDYDAPIAGLEVVDRYTLRIRLNAPDLRFPYVLALQNVAAQAREVVEAYGADIGAHPVGTGPYMLGEYRRSNRIVLVANPTYRESRYEPAGPMPEASRAVAAALKGRLLPLTSRVEVNIIEEGQARWLAFMNRELDFLDILPVEFTEQALDARGNLLPDLAKRGITHDVLLRPNTWWFYFNMEDPVVGGYTPEKIALRRAIIMGYRDDEERRIVRKGQMRYIAMPVPPGVVGYDPNYVAVDHYDPVLANALLDHFGYRKGADGWRTLPDGKPLVIHYATGSSAIEREFSELWKRSMDDLGLRIEFDIAKFADHLKAAKACHLMMWGAAWIADWPDADNFMQLLYGPNTGQSNNGCYQSPAFDKLYEASTHLPTDSTERMKLFLDMARQMQVDGAWQVSGSRLRNQLLWPWVLGYKKHPILQAEWVYMDMAPRS
jgi:ABC-type transport system substrate-binding protein